MLSEGCYEIIPQRKELLRTYVTKTKQDAHNLRVNTALHQCFLGEQKSLGRTFILKKVMLVSRSTVDLRSWRRALSVAGKLFCRRKKKNFYLTRRQQIIFVYQYLNSLVQSLVKYFMRFVLQNGAMTKSFWPSSNVP